MDDELEEWLSRIEFECEHAENAKRLFREDVKVSASAPPNIWRERIGRIRALQQNQKKGKKHG